MNYIKQLTGFFEKVHTDHRLNPTHISLYISLFQQWNLNRFQNPISITRDEIMCISKISSKATYHKCIRELHYFGYLVYQPSYNPYRGSLVTMADLAATLKPIPRRRLPLAEDAGSHTEAKQVVNRCRTCTIPINEPSLNSINVLNFSKYKSNVGRQAIKAPSVLKIERVRRVPEAKEESTAAAAPAFLPPSLAAVKTFFSEQLAPAAEAEKFFNYFESTGWLVGGRTPMKDWKAAARNWLLNTGNFNRQPRQTRLRPAHLQTETSKHYDEPL